MVYISLITAEVSCARFQDSSVGASAWVTYRFPYMRRLHKMQDYAIAPTAFDAGAKGLNHSAQCVYEIRSSIIRSVILPSLIRIIFSNSKSSIKLAD